ncbi:MAG: hypothetical protein LW768_16585, partial [Rubrivivax sp.]|nr:hypothetical protein [Rubrivivax sp.]
MSQGTACAGHHRTHPASKVHPQKIANGALQTFAAWRQALRVDAQFTKRFSAYTEPINLNPAVTPSPVA